MLIFQKNLLEYASGFLNTQQRFQNIEKWKDEYTLPFRSQPSSNIEDFYSILQLRVAYDVDKYNYPVFKVCKPINITDYNINPAKNIPDTWDVQIQGWQQTGWPHIWSRISEETPKYVFVSKNSFKIFPTPTKNVTRGLSLTYNYMPQPLTYEQVWDDSIDESELNLPRYFFDAIDDYMTYRLFLAENPEEAEIHYQTFINTLHDNIYWLNRDQRSIEEEFANLSYFYKG